MAARLNIDRAALFFRAAAFIQGFAFILYFRSLLDDFYPFFRGFFPLSQFALLLFAIGFVAAVRYQNLPSGSRRMLYWLLVALSVSGFLAVKILWGHDRTLLLFPLPTAFVSLLLWYELARHTFIYQRAKLELIAGYVAAIFVGELKNLSYVALVILLLATFFARLQNPPQWQVAYERLLYLRQSIDFLRYLFIAQAFHGILGQNRHNLVPVVVLTITGLAAPQVLRFLKTPRPHIQKGLLVLPLVFVVLAGLFNAIHYNLWGACAYTLLASWEAIYFSRTHEVYLRREKVLAGIAIAAGLVAYYISTDWLQILAGIIVATFLCVTLFYVAKNWRKTITAIFGLAVICWGFALQWKYTHSVTREFYRPPQPKLRTAQLPDTGLVIAIMNLQKNTGWPIRTNILPQELLADEAWRGENISTMSGDPAGLLLRFTYHCFLNRSSTIFILDEKSLGVYAEANSLMILREFFAQVPHCRFFLSDGTALREISNLSQLLQSDPQRLQNLTREDTAKILGLARVVKRRDMLAEAQALYDQILPLYRDDPAFLRELSSLVAARGQLERQIELLNMLISLGKDNTTYDKKLLMELYAIRNERKKSAALAREILNLGVESPLAIYAFLQKLFSDPFDRNEMQNLYQELLRYQPKTDLEIIKYAGLKRSIEDRLKQNPTYDRKYQDENHRQEFISFPE